MRHHVDSSDVANVAIPEIEITPAMIEAGVLVLLDYDDRFMSDEDCVELIYRAMAGAGD